MCNNGLILWIVLSYLNHRGQTLATLCSFRSSRPHRTYGQRHAKGHTGSICEGCLFHGEMQWHYNKLELDAAGSGSHSKRGREK